MLLVDRGELIGPGGNSTIGSIDGVCESCRRVHASLSVPIERLIKVAMGARK